MQVLLAEDNPINRQVATGLLERLGHSVTAVTDGVEALAALRTGRYDLVLMDVMMPRMDGLAATRMVRAAETAGEHVTIVGVTAGSRLEDLQACLDAGMDGVTTKPVTLERLRMAVAKGRGQAASFRRPAEPPPARSRLDELRDELGAELVAVIVEAFKEDARAQLDGLRVAHERNDVAGLARQAHSLAGASRNVGAEALGSCASRLEREAATMDAAPIAAALAVLERELAAWILRHSDATNLVPVEVG